MKGCSNRVEQKGTFHMIILLYLAIEAQCERTSASDNRQRKNKLDEVEFAVTSTVETRTLADCSRLVPLRVISMPT